VSGAVYDFGAADQDAGIDSERPPEQAKNDESSNTNSTAADRDTHTAAAAGEASLVTAAVFDIVAAAKIIPTHYEILPKFFTCSSTSSRDQHGFKFRSVSYCLQRH
jgi:hypothetical protein